jgi:hypothetical protein
MDDIEVTHAAFAASEQAPVIVSTVIAVLKVTNEAPTVLGVGASVGVLVGESVGLLLGATDGWKLGASDGCELGAFDG